MTHFAQSDWADFARGIRIARRKEMQVHLVACQRCQKSVEIWRELRQTAEVRGVAAEIPASTLKMVKAAFAFHYPRKASRAKQLATLVFDSLREPAMAEGVRAVSTRVGPNTRQLLYRGGSYVVDLHLERQDNSSIVVLVGQVFDLSKKGGGNLLRIVLERGRTILAAAVATEFGEFIFEYEEKGDMRLRLESLGQKALTVPLNELEHAVTATARAGY